MKMLIYIVAWLLIITGIVLGEIALGIIGGTAAVLGSLALIMIFIGVGASVAIHADQDRPTKEQVEL